MPLNPNIPLQARASDLSGLGQAFSRGQQDARSNRQLDIAEQQAQGQQEVRQSQLEGQNIKNIDAREQQRLTSLVKGASQVQGFINSGREDQIEPYLQNRLVQLDELGIDSSDTARELESFKNDPESFKKGVGEAIQIGFQTGILKDPTRSENLPSSIKEFNFAQQLSPEQKKNFLEIKRENKGFFIDPNTGKATAIEGFTDVKRDIESAKAGGKKEGALEVEKSFNIPKAQASFRSSTDKLNNVLDKINKVLPDINSATAGLGGVILSKIPGTKARDLEATIQTIVANLGFKELQEMRDNSPTGGALGQVSERELALLNSAKQNLENSQTPEQLKENLEDLKAQIRLSQKRIKQAFEDDFGRFGGEVPQQEEVNIIDFNDL